MLRRESVNTTPLPSSRRCQNTNGLDTIGPEFPDVLPGVQLLVKAVPTAVLNAANLMLGYVWICCVQFGLVDTFMNAGIRNLSCRKRKKAIKRVAEGGELWFCGPMSKSQHLTQPRIQARNPSQCKDHGVHSHYAPLDLDWMQCSLRCEHRDQSNFGMAGT